VRAAVLALVALTPTVPTSAAIDEASPSPVTIENERAGTPGWAHFGTPPNRAIEGYTEPSAVPGGTLTFHVSAEPEADYRILVYRVGYYGGAGARLAGCLPSCGGSARARTEDVPNPSPEGLVHAGWPVGQRLDVPLDWVSGYYVVFFVLTSGPYHGQAATTWFILRQKPGAERSPILVQAPPTTWEAYNGWGGGSFYEFNSPRGRRAAKIAFDRPYDQQPQEQIWDVPLVRFLEQNGYDVSYQADVDTARDPSSLEGRRLVIVAGHGEYWSKEIRDAFHRARDAGTNLAFFGANAAYWQVRYEDDYRTIVGYKSAAWDPETDPQLETVLFRELVPGRAECALIGIQHMGGPLNWTTDGDYTATDATASDPWFRGTGYVAGNLVRGVVSREVDTIPGTQSADNSCGNHLTVLFHREYGGPYNGNADAIRYTASSGAKVFASGSHQFSWGLADVPELDRMRHGLVDPRLQRFVHDMLDDLTTPVAHAEPPRSTDRPRVTGQPVVGRKLTCLRGSWTGTLPLRFGYRWLRDGRRLAGAAHARYRPVPRDAARRIACRVHAANSAGFGEATSRPVRVRARRAGAQP
jgi:N,N-dimethylformamidase beta subunit-like, C-terminal